MWNKNTDTRIAPSILERDLFISIKTTGNRIIKNINIASFFILGLSILIPLPSIMAIPIIRVKTAIFEPITVPRIKAGFFINAAEMPTNSSGTDVANAIKINAATNSLIFRKEAILERLFIKNEPLTIKTTHETVKNNKLVANISLPLFFWLYS